MISSMTSCHSPCLTHEGLFVSSPTILISGFPLTVPREEKGGGETFELVRADIPPPAGQTSNILTLSPQAPEGGIVYPDDALVTVPNPAW